MNKKTIIPIVIALILVGGAGVLVTRRGVDTAQPSPDRVPAENVFPVTEDTSQLPAATGSAPVPEPTQVKPPTVSGRFSGEEDIEGSDVQVFDISYDGTNFTPNTLSIKNGDVVIFKNKSKVAFWPASDPHPTHTDYPEFDAKQPVLAGKSYQFKFTRTGTWKFHDHSNVSAKGSVVVVP
ncbi:MAG: hypothetical protein JNK33_03760 [Candidatus Doudnabacteria bacterium]|nr:hypothetical protein [Candidatus Doudnabacteria bacterium]